MNYFGKKILLTGASGFIGGALFKELTKNGAYIVRFDGDVRDTEEVMEVIDYTFDYVFHFGSPSSQILFKRQPLYCAETTLMGFFNIARACKLNGVKLIYPSTGLIAHNKLNEYARCKKVCEDVHLTDGLDAIGIRLYAAYGQGESHKRDYASVPYIFMRDIVNDKQPVIFGDGKQQRDFIYIDDAIQAILHIAEEASEPIVEVGSGEGVDFNTLVSKINNIHGTDIEPIYQGKPADYIEKTFCDPTIMHKYYVPKYSLDGGIEKTLEGLTYDEE